MPLGSTTQRPDRQETGAHRVPTRPRAVQSATESHWHSPSMQTSPQQLWPAPQSWPAVQVAVGQVDWPKTQEPSQQTPSSPAHGVSSATGTGTHSPKLPESGLHTRVWHVPPVSQTTGWQTPAPSQT
jgi:hypothetical protein